MPADRASLSVSLVSSAVTSTKTGLESAWFPTQATARRRARAAPGARARPARPPFARGERGESARRQPTGVEEVARPVDHADNREHQGALEAAIIPAEVRDLAEPEKHHVRSPSVGDPAAAELVQLKRRMHQALRAHGLARVHDDG